MAARLVAVFGLVGGAAAQCTLPEALPADTQFAAGNPAECELGERTHLHACLPSVCMVRPWQGLFAVERADGIIGVLLLLSLLVVV